MGTGFIHSTTTGEPGPVGHQRYKAGRWGMGQRGGQSKDNTVWSGQRWGRSAGWGCPREGHPAEHRRNPEALPGGEAARSPPGPSNRVQRVVCRHGRQRRRGRQEEERAGPAALGGHSTPSGLYLRTQRQPRNAVGTRMGVQSREVVLQDSGEELMIAQTWW